MGLLAQLRSAGLQLRTQGNQLLVEPKTALTEELRAVIRQNKAAILGELEKDLGGGPPLTPAQEAARREVLRKLQEHPSIARAYDVRCEAGVFLVALAVRGVGTCELSIPTDRLNPSNLADAAKLLECLGPQAAPPEVAA